MMPGFFIGVLAAAYAQTEALPKVPTDIKPACVTYEDIEQKIKVKTLTIAGERTRGFFPTYGDHPGLRSRSAHGSAVLLKAPPYTS
jgi:hypothetical protein